MNAKLDQILSDAQAGLNLLGHAIDDLSAVGIVFPEIGLIDIGAKAAASGLGFIRKRASGETVTIEQVRDSHAEAIAALEKMSQAAQAERG